MNYLNQYEIHKLISFDKFNENNFGLEKYGIFSLSFNKNIILIIKFTNYKKVKQETNLIKLVNSIYKNFFVEIIYVNICEKIPFYVMEYIIGQPVLLKLKDDSFYNWIIIKILQKLKKLHKLTSRKYKNNYHNIIVDYRIDNIICCSILNRNIQSINHPIIKNIHSLFKMCFIKQGSTKELNIKNLLLEQKYIYNKFIPNNESIIHGDPNLENIIITSDNKIRFIDPRTQWDDKENIDNEGYFDNLYDIASITSSIIVNYIILLDLQQFQFDKNQILYNQVIEDQIQHYINNHAEKIFNQYFQIDNETYIKEEKIRFMVYLTCSLIGFIRYKKFLININFILYILLLVCYINIYINKILTREI